jgi:hypothetical protein
MQILRMVLVLAVVGYAGYLAWPFVSPLLEGADATAAVTRAFAEAGAEGVTPALLWIGAVVLYLIAAALLGAGNPRAVVAYFLGFMADAVLRLALERSRGAPDVAARSEAALVEGGPKSLPVDMGSSLGVDPLWLVLAGLVGLGLVIFLATRRVRQARASGALA